MNNENSNSKNELVNISKKLFNLIGLEISNSQIKQQILKHHDYPNVNALTSMFTFNEIWHIREKCIKNLTA
jgi:hypothetical protein|tara:strand:+ start:1328 stop:1540 length:213 start_codon:yes stop_codon:yes gene_type:complete